MQTLWKKELESLVGKLFSGAALAVGRLNQKTEMHVVGHLSPSPGSSPVKTATLFDLSSLTKVFLTTPVLARLVNQNRIALNDSLCDWWPELPWAQGWKWTRVRDVLAHSAGFPAWQDVSKLSVSEVFRSIVRIDPQSISGERTLYSDLGFILLAGVLEKKTGQTWIRLCEEEVIKPLRLAQMIPSPIQQASFPDGVVVTAPTQKEQTKWVEANDANVRALGGVSGHAGFFADLESCALVTQAWLEAIEGKGHFLSQNVAHEFAFPTKVKSGEGRALGWDVPSLPISSGGKKISCQAIGHLGFTGTSVWIDLARKAWVVLLTNRTSLGTSKEAMRDFRVKLHDMIWEWVDR